MKLRPICPAGQYGSVVNADQNTMCAPCLMGTYIDTRGWHACAQLEKCSGQRMDTNTQTALTGQTQQSTCVQDFDLARVNAGYYPRLNTRDTQQVFTYNTHWYVKIHEYVACVDVASNTRLCAKSVTTRCVHAFLVAWIAGSISLQTLASNSEYAYSLWANPAWGSPWMQHCRRVCRVHAARTKHTVGLRECVCHVSLGKSMPFPRAWQSVKTALTASFRSTPLCAQTYVVSAKHTPWVITVSGAHRGIYAKNPATRPSTYPRVI